MRVRLRAVATSAPGERFMCPGTRRDSGRVCGQWILAGRPAGMFTFVCPRCRNLIEVAAVDPTAQTG